MSATVAPRVCNSRTALTVAAALVLGGSAGGAAADGAAAPAPDRLELFIRDAAALCLARRGGNSKSTPATR